MKILATLLLLLPLQLILVRKGAAASSGTKTSQQSCIPAHPDVTTFVQKKSCSPYKYSENGYCKDVIGNRDVYGSDQEKMEKNLQRFIIGKRMLEGYIPVPVRDSCFKFFNISYCEYSFPKCDLTSSKPLGKPVCRETCEDAMQRCDKEIELLKGFNMQRIGDSANGNDYPLYWKLVNCSSLQYRNGGDLPECYFSRYLNSETDKLKNTSCYYGNGLGYRGNVSVTRSGHVCQSWSSQCPHRHDHPLSEYPELVNASNWCRNPGGQGPDGPWCYTTNRSIRWEYCNVEKCPPSAPTRSPVVSQAYATGSSKIYITWELVPLAFFHGQPGGYRIKISELGQEPMVNTTSPNVTDFEYRNLQALTNYSLSVLAFNDAGDGPSSRVFVKTMPENSVTVRYTLNLTLTLSSRIGLNLNSKKLSSMVRKKVLDLFGNDQPTNGYDIYRMNIIKVTNSSAGYVVTFDITAELKGRPSWSAVQDITGRFLRQSELRLLTVEAPPPPPANVSTSDVEMTLVTVDWSAPLYHGPYRITNYTVQYKKAGTDMKYYDAVTVGSHKTKVTVKNLDSGQKYLMRVTSVNSQGFEASEPLKVETPEDDGKVNVLAIVLSFVAVIVVLLVIGAFCGRRKLKESNEMQKKLQKLRENPYESAVDWFAVLKIKITKQWWEIPRDDLLLDGELGSGAFGVVMKGYLTKREEGENENRILCAVKMLKDNPTERELRDLCNEINVMSSVGDHPNLVSLIGACTINGPLWLVVKFAPNGCLLDYLKDHRPPPEYQNTREDVTKSQLMLKPISEKERMRFAYEIGQGMAHLERHRYIHRDLAARNVLLGKNMVAMVSDFGMSRDIYETGAYENTAGGVLPVRWMALESLEDYTYTSKSDVWSYGVVLWEIESEGLMPYAGMSGVEVVERLRQGHRLERPDKASRDTYEVMWQCWNPDPNKRPTFADLVYKIGGLFNMTGDYDTIETLPDNNDKAQEDTKHEDKMDKTRGQVNIAVIKNLSFIDGDIDM